MARFTGTVLIDTNVIIEAHRVGAWKALTSGYAIETVEDVVIETMTGYQRRDPAQVIDQPTLRASLKAVHAVSTLQLATVALEAGEIQLDNGEKALWAHLLTRGDVWMMCGPDKASLRFGVRMKFRDRMIALETLLDDIGTRPKIELKPGYGRKWLDGKLSEYVVMEAWKAR